MADTKEERRKGLPCGHQFVFGEPQEKNQTIVKCCCCDWSKLRDGKQMRKEDLTRVKFIETKQNWGEA
jgi:hypothetical protein